MRIEDQHNATELIPYDTIKNKQLNHMKFINLIFSLMLLSASTLSAQNVGINATGAAPASSAMLDVASTSSGMLVPRMTAAQRGDIASPATGLLVYQTDDTAGFYYYNGSTWTQIGNASGATQWTTTGSDIYYNTGNIGIGTSSPNRLLEIYGSKDDGSLVGIRLNNSSSSGTYSNVKMGIEFYNSGSYEGALYADRNSRTYLESGALNKPLILQNNGGNVGIGITNPVHKLTVSGSGTSNTGVLGINVSGSGSFNWASSAIASNLASENNLIHMLGKAESEYNCGYIGYNFQELGSSSNFLTFGLHSHDNLLNLTGAGNVGIGTTNPGAKLHIEGDGSSYLNVAQIIRSTGTNYGPSLRLEATGTNGKTYALYSGQTGDGNAGIFSIYEVGSGNRLVINNGNVGIGTTSPGKKLTVNGYMGFEGNTDNRIYFGDNDYLSFTDGTGDGLKFIYDSFEKLRIDNNGRVGIGTTTPICPLHVIGSSTINAGARYFNGGTDLIINTTDFNVTILANHDIMANGSFVATSDRRVKENITPISNSIKTIEKLRPVTYNKIDKIQNGDRLNYGFIAQEVEEVLPEAVNTGKGEIPVLKTFENITFEEGVEYSILVKNGDEINEMKYKKGDERPDGEIIVKSKTVNDFKSLSYDMIFTVAVDAIQEQQTEIKTLQKEVEALKTQNATLTKKTEDIDRLSVEMENLKKAINSAKLQLTSNN